MFDDIHKPVAIYQRDALKTTAPVAIISMALLFHTLIEDQGWTLDILDFHAQLAGNGYGCFCEFCFELLSGKEVQHA